jgi:F0F1-type ATP synthase epsilon subunit
MDMDKLFELTVINQDSMLYQGKISLLTALFAAGSAQILAGHASFAALTRPGNIKIIDQEGKTVILAIPSKGLFHSSNDKSTLIF